jgi:hypothetical protein
MADTLTWHLNELRSLASSYKNRAANANEPAHRRIYYDGSADGLMEAVNRLQALMRRADAEEAEEPVAAIARRS